MLQNGALNTLMRIRRAAFAVSKYSQITKRRKPRRNIPRRGRARARLLRFAAFAGMGKVSTFERSARPVNRPRSRSHMRRVCGAFFAPVPRRARSPLQPPAMVPAARCAPGNAPGTARGVLTLQPFEPCARHGAPLRPECARGASATVPPCNRPPGYRGRDARPVAAFPRAFPLQPPAPGYRVRAELVSPYWNMVVGMVFAIA